MSFMDKLNLGKLGKKKEAPAAVPPQHDADALVGESEVIAESTVESLAMSSSVAEPPESIVETTTSEAPPAPKKKGFLSSLMGSGKQRAKSAAKPRSERRKSAGSRLAETFQNTLQGQPRTIVRQASASIDEAAMADLGSRPRPLPVIGHLPAKTQYTIALGIALISLAVAAVLAFVSFRESAVATQRAEVATRIMMLTQRLASTAAAAITGDQAALAKVKEARQDFGAQMRSLASGNPATGLPALPDELVPTVQKLRGSVKAMEDSADRIIESSAALEAIKANAAAADRASGRMFLSAEQLQSYFAANGSPAFYASVSAHMAVMTNRVRYQAATLLSSDEVRIDLLGELTADFASLRGAATSLEKGDDKLGVAPLTDPMALALLADFKAAMNDFAKPVAYIEKNATQMVAARRNMAALQKAADESLRDATAVSQVMAGQTGRAQMLAYSAAALAALAVLGLVLLGAINNRLTRIDAWEAAMRAKVNERDFIDFMKKVAPLEEGDLTVNYVDDMRALEGMTGGMRTSLNDATKSLRMALRATKDTTEYVAREVRESVQATNELIEANNTQAQEIGMVIQRVSDLTGAIERVTDNTARAADVTRATKEASQQGAEVVSQNNQQMSKIRANMQDVLKSVKTLSESSAEITTVVEEVAKLVERVQVLAFNSSLEAQKAGAAGKGFLVLAGEIDRLAVQSEGSLTSITALVQRVQGETAGTVRTVEESTKNVVEGARLAEAANERLERISSQADQLNRIMAEIAEQARGQSADASAVKDSMSRLAQVSSNVQKALTQVIGAVKKIDNSAVRLKSTVSEFKTETAA